MFTGSRTAQFCRDITITHTAVIGKSYAIEQSHFLTNWHKISHSETVLWLQATNTIMTRRFGSPYAWNFFRLVEQ